MLLSFLSKSRCYFHYTIFGTGFASVRTIKIIRIFVLRNGHIDGGVLDVLKSEAETADSTGAVAGSACGMSANISISNLSYTGVSILLYLSQYKTKFGYDVNVFLIF